MPQSRPDPKSLIGRDAKDVPMSLKRIMAESSQADSLWIGPQDAMSLTKEDGEAYRLAHAIMCHLAIRAPLEHSSGHPGGPLSSFTFAYFLSKRRDPSVDQPLRMSAGHLSVLAYGLQWLFGREGSDDRLQSPDAIIKTFRTVKGLPGHAEAGVGDIPFGAGPLGKGVSNGLGAAFGLKYLKKPGTVDVLMADGDSQEGQTMEAFRLASHLKVDNFIVHGDFNDIQLSTMPSKTVACDFASIAQATGWQVIEVQNGNDPEMVSAALDRAESLLGKGRPIFICYYTTMGQGVKVMEEGSNTGKENFHGSPLKPEVAKKALKDLPALSQLIKEFEPHRAKDKERYRASPPVETDFSLPWDTKKLKGYERIISEEKGAARKDFGAVHIKELMKSDPRIFVLHADLAASGGFEKVEKEFPARVLNVGVAEANMYMMAAGMRQVGMLPLTYTFAAFGTNEARANARLIDINLGHTRCGILNVCTHAGVNVGEDGETHQEQNYLNIPLYNTKVWVPADSNQAAAMAEKAMEVIAEGYKSIYVHMPRISHEQLRGPDGKLLYGKDSEFSETADLVRGKGDVTDQLTILATGMSVHEAATAADNLKEGGEKLQIRVLNVASIRPFDAAAVIQAALETVYLVVVEDHNTEGGLAGLVADVIADFQLPCSLRRIGLSHYFPSGPAKDLVYLAGLDAKSIADAVQDELHTEVCGGEDVITTPLFTLPHNLKHSRFRETAAPFAQRLKTEDGYLESIREKWVTRACDPTKIPSSDDLKRHLP